MQKARFQPSRRTVCGILGAALVMPRTAFGAQLESVTGRAFGTTWRLVAPTGSKLAPLRSAIEDLFDEVDRTFSPWRSDSVLARFNATSADQFTRDTDLAHVTAAALAVASQSGGTFDPTVGPLVARWGFGPIHDGGAPDWRALVVDAETVRKTRDDLTLDLCGIAKGWALDRAAERVEAEGIDNYLFELGGEVLARGNHPEGRAWRVAVHVPAYSSGVPPAVQLPSGSAVATSGQWVQGYRLDDRLYGHIIDTATAEPVAGALRSVTVVADDAMSADGWATALCAAGADAGPDLARSQDLAALFLIETAGGALRATETGPFHELLL